MSHHRPSMRTWAVTRRSRSGYSLHVLSPVRTIVSSEMMLFGRFFFATLLSTFDFILSFSRPKPDLPKERLASIRGYMFFTATRVALFSSFQSVFASPEARTNGSFSSSSNVLQIAAISFR